MTAAQSSEAIANEIRCTSYSKSRSRYCLAYGRYECRSDDCDHRSCGLHVVRNNLGIYCPQCGGPVRASKH